MTSTADLSQDWEWFEIPGIQRMAALVPCSDTKFVFASEAGSLGVLNRETGHCVALIQDPLEGWISGTGSAKYVPSHDKRWLADWHSGETFKLWSLTQDCPLLLWEYALPQIPGALTGVERIESAVVTALSRV